MSTDRFAERRERLVASLPETVDGILVTAPLNVTYLTGFTGDSSFLLLSRGRTVLLSDTRYTVQIEQEAPGLEVEIRDSSQTMKAAVAETVGKLGLSSLGFEANDLTVATLDSLKTALAEVNAGTVWVPLENTVETLRQIKDDAEIAETRRAIHMAERGFRSAIASLRGGMTERELAFDLEHAMRGFGAEKAGFDPIVAVGPNAALPHARPGSRRIEEDPLLLIDWGAETYSRYRSDQTRVVFPGTPTDRHREVYEVVLAAHEAGIAAIHPEAAAVDVDRAARKVIEDAGYGDRFGHGLGHGLGLHIHEALRLSPLSKEVLKPGMLVTIEPGIYIPGWGGFRIEDDILVTEDGRENLCSLPKDFESAIVES